MEQEQNPIPVASEIPQSSQLQNEQVVAKTTWSKIFLVVIGIVIVIGIGIGGYLLGRKNNSQSNDQPKQHSIVQENKKSQTVTAGYFYGTRLSSEATDYVVVNALTDKVTYQIDPTLLKQLGYIHKTSVSPNNKYIGIVSVRKENTLYTEVITTISLSDYSSQEIYAKVLPQGELYYPGRDSILNLPLVWSSDSKYVLSLSAVGEKQDMIIINPITKEQKQITTDGMAKYNIVSSPLGDKILFMQRDGSDQYGTVGSYYIYNILTQQMTKLVSNDPTTQKLFVTRKENAKQQVYFSDENTLIFSIPSTFIKEKDDPAIIGIWRIDLTGVTSKRLVTQPLDPNGEVVGSPDGKALSYKQIDVYGAEGQDARYSLWVVQLQNNQLTKLASSSLSGFTNLGWSPDSKMFAYGSTVGSTGTKTYSVYAIATNESKKIIDEKTDHILDGEAWSPDSQSLFIRDSVENKGEVQFSSNIVISAAGNILQNISDAIMPQKWFVK